MSERTIHSKAGEDVAAIAARLDGLAPGRVVLVFDDGSSDPNHSLSRLDLLRLQRYATHHGLELGLVAADLDLIEEARALGLPVFDSIHKAQRRKWPSPAQKSRIVSQTPAVIDPDDVLEMWRRNRALRRQPHWLVWAVSALVFALTLAGLVATVLVIWPNARVRLVPISRPVTAVVTLVADPAVTEADEAAGVVPARYLPVEVENQAQITTSGTKDIPDTPASGKVVFINILPQPVSIPKGTIVRTSAGVPVRFATTDNVDVPAAGGAMAPVEALDLGPVGNVAAGVINRIEGSLALQLRVTNPEPTQGGSARQVRAVSQTDRDRLQAALLQQLQEQALAQVSADLKPTEFVVTPSLRLVDVLDASYDRYVGEQADLLGMQMRVRMQVIAVDEAPARTLALAALARQVPPGYTLIPASVTTPRRSESVQVDENGRITFRMAASGAVAAQVDLNEVKRAIRGQPLVKVRDYLASKLPLARPPQIEVSPAWFPYLPFLSVRTTVELTTVGDGQ